MKLREEENNIERGGDIVESMFGISGKDSAHILNILRSKLYSNKILAVIREYCANAQDAHADAGKDTLPIEVHLPNRFDPTFRVRDYGLGLSEDDVRNIYVMYGASTKRTSNKAIGQLGLGCKSAFAYTEKFNVISWNGGEKKTYCAYIDETKCGKIALLASEKTDDPNGIEIQIPARNSDFNNFEREAEGLLQYFKPIPNITGITLSAPKYWLEGTLKDGVKFCCKEQENLRYNSSATSRVIMGGIPYVIAGNDKLVLGDWGSKSRQFLGLGIDIYVNIGDLEVTANREDLEYTDHTIKTLVKYIEEAADEALKLGTKEIVNSPTYREANIKYHKMASNRQFWRHASKVVLWKNKPLDGMMCPNSSDTEIFCPIKYTTKIRWNEVVEISADTDELFLFDIDDMKSWKRKLIEYATYKKLNLRNVKAIIWSGNDDVDRTITRTKIYKERILDEYAIQRISKCKTPSSELSLIQTTLAPFRSNTHMGTVFSPKSYDTRLGTNRCKSKNWTRIDKIPDGDKYYIEIDKFLPKINNQSGCALSSLDALIKTIGLAGTKIDYKDIYGIKKKQVAKTTGDTEWIALDIAAKEIIEKSKIPLEVADTIEFVGEATTSTVVFTAIKDTFPTESIAFKLLNEISRLQEIKTRISPELHSIKNCMGKLDIKIPAPSVQLKSLLNAAADRYPLISIPNVFPYDNDYYYYRSDEEKMFKKMFPYVTEYIKFIENSKEKVA